MSERLHKTDETILPLQGERFIIAGGGTGGHIFPAIAIANALREKITGAEILFVGAKGKMEMEKIPQAGYQVIGLDIAGFNRQSVFKNVSLPFKLLKSLWQVKKIIADFKPDAVIGVGGYSTFPVLRTAQKKGIPSFIHESNSFGGKSNMLLAKKATAVFVGGDGMEKFFPKEKIVITGNPVRKSIADNRISRAEALSFFGLSADQKTILVIGGSLGARSINEAIASKISAFAENDLQLIWQTGKTTADIFKKAGEAQANIRVNDFIREMEMAYAAADVVVSRAGAMSVTEIAVSGKPAVFVPFPLAAEDHQTANAMWLVSKNAALIVRDGEAKEKLVDVVIALAKDVNKQNEIKANLSGLAIRDADERIADEIIKRIR